MASARTRAGQVRSDSGAVAVTVAIMLIILLGVAALAIDVGALYSERRQMQTAADAAVLAGVQVLPGSPEQAVALAGEYATLNTAHADEVAFHVESTYGANDTIVAELRDPDKGLYFARFLGRETAPVGATATAVVASPVAYGVGVMPFGIMSKEPSGTAPFGYVVNDLVRLKQPAQSGESGNFLFLSLTDPPGEHEGANDINNAIENGGVSVPVFRDEIYMTRPGMNGVQIINNLERWLAGDACSFTDVVEVNPDGTAEILDEECHRVIVCPIILDPGPPVVCNWNDMNGSTDALVVGFAYFYIEAWGTTGNDCWIDGRFIRPVGPEDPVLEWGAVDPNGAIAYRLVD